MNRFLNPGDRRGLLLSVLMVVIGLVLALWPGHVMTTALSVLGIALLIGGVVNCAAWYRGRARGADFLTLAQGILMLVAGIVVLAAPKFLISIVPFAVGVVVLVNGIVNLAQALDQRRMGYGRWSFSLALAVLTIVLGVLVICNPFSTMEMLVMAIGIVVAYNGLSNLWIESRYRKL